MKRSSWGGKWLTIRPFWVGKNALEAANESRKVAQNWAIPKGKWLNN